MKVIYAYKLFELNAKRLVKLFYPKVPVRNLFQWEVLKDFFKSKNIKFSEIDSFSELNDLRKVNNNLKHSCIVDKEILKIKEFTKEGSYNYNELEAFYERVNKAPVKFLQSLANAIKKERFVFDDERIENIAHEFAKRMEPELAERFIQKLNAKYE